MTTIRIYCALITLCAAFFISCGGKPEQRPSSVFTDDLRRSVMIPQPLRRIVSLAPSITETIYALGADSLLVGVTDYCDFPPAAKLKPKIGGMTTPDIERIVSLKPDCVLMSVEGNLRTDFDRIEKTGIPVFSLNPRSIDDVLKSITLLGDITGMKRQALELRDRLSHRMDSIVACIAMASYRPRVYVIVSLKPLMVVGKGTFVNELLDKAGGINAGAEGVGTYPIMSREDVVKNQPDCLVLMSDIAVPPGVLLKEFPEWKNLNAVRNKKVFSVDASIVSRPGPRVIDGLEELAKKIHE